LYDELLALRKGMETADGALSDRGAVARYCGTTVDVTRTATMSRSIRRVLCSRRGRGRTLSDTSVL
jgi:hypothetical protein